MLKESPTGDFPGTSVLPIYHEKHRKELGLSETKKEGSETCLLQLLESSS